jgi:hypothetical protein
MEIGRAGDAMEKAEGAADRADKWQVCGMMRAMAILVCGGLILGCATETRVVRDNSATTRFLSAVQGGNTYGSGGWSVQGGGVQQPKRTSQNSGNLPSAYWNSWNLSTSFQIDEPAATQPAEVLSPAGQASPFGAAPRAPGR